MKSKSYLQFIEKSKPIPTYFQSIEDAIEKIKLLHNFKSIADVNFSENKHQITFKEDNDHKYAVHTFILNTKFRLIETKFFYQKK